MQWYYLSESFERIPVREAQFDALAARGILRPATPVWRKGMPDWTTCGEVKPEIFAAAVHRGSDQHHPATDNAAVRGAVIGLSRTLASYSGALRLLGTGLIPIGGSLLALAGWTAWTFSETGFTEWNWGRVFPSHWGDQPWGNWLVSAFVALAGFLTVWGGFLLLRSAARAKRAMETGNELVLSSAISDTGRYFLLTAVITMLGVILWLGLWLWMSRHAAFPKPPAPSEKRVTV